MADRVDGYYGMWDDLSKIDPERDAGFRRLLRRAGIHPIAFNDRDLAHPIRVWAIRYDLTTSLAAAHRQLGRGERTKSDGHPWASDCHEAKLDPARSTDPHGRPRSLACGIFSEAHPHFRSRAKSSAPCTWCSFRSIVDTPSTSTDYA